MRPESETSPGSGADPGSGPGPSTGAGRGHDADRGYDPGADPRSLSFGEVAEDYDRYRPELPEAALDWLLPPGCLTALDLGAGTGSATRVLVRRVPRVTAVEPDPRMRALLARSTPEIQVVEGRAEAIPLADASVDVVLVCSAWHWMEPDIAAREVARVLRVGGVWGILWNSLDRTVPWIAELRRLTGQPDPEDERGRSRRPEDVRLAEGAPFGPPEITTIAWTWHAAPDELLGLMGTYSSVIVLEPNERAKVMARVRECISCLHPDSGSKNIAVPMACRCWKVVRT